MISASLVDNSAVPGDDLSAVRSTFNVPEY